jgi:uncharacterized protein YqeY
LLDYVAKEKKMSVIEKLKTESMALRKVRSPIAPSILFALSEIEKVGKNNGNRETTEDEAIKVIQKLIVTIDENLKLNIDDGRRVSLNFEKNILSGVLPQMAPEEEIRSKLVFAFGGKQVQNKGEIMKWAKSHWGVLADMKQVGAIASELFGV